MTVFNFTYTKGMYVAEPGKSDVILQAALDLISERGFHNAPSSLIAKRAGVSEGSIYRYFKTKDELIHEISLHITREFHKAILKGYPSDNALRERFFHVCTAALRYFIKHPRLLRYSDQFSMSPFSTSTGIREIHSELELKDGLLDLINEGVTQEVFKDLPVPTLHRLTTSSLRALARSHSAGNKLNNDSLVLAVEACWDALKKSG